MLTVHTSPFVKHVRSTGIGNSLWMIREVGKDWT
jgi:hypothetical protein